MHVRFIKTLISFLLCFSIFLVSAVSAQKKVRKPPTNGAISSACQVAYEDVIDYLFPALFVGQGEGYGMRLRYSPPNRPEIQVNIFHPSPGRFQVDLYKPKNGSIRLQLQDLQLKNGRLGFAKIVKQIQVEKIRIDLTEEEVRSIQAGFMDIIKEYAVYEARRDKNPRSEVTITFDPPGYEIQYFGSGNVRLWGEGPPILGEPAKDEPPFVEWMRGVYRKIAKKHRVENSFLN